MIYTAPRLSHFQFGHTDETTKPATPWYGVSALYPDNLIGNVVDQGYYTDRGRTGSLLSETYL